MRDGNITRRACLVGIGAGVAGCLGNEEGTQEFEKADFREGYELNPGGDTSVYVDITHPGWNIDIEELGAEIEITRVEFGDNNESGVAYEPEKTVVFSDGSEADMEKKRILDQADIPSKSYENARIYGTVESFRTSEGETEAILGKRGYVETHGDDRFEEHEAVGCRYGLEVVEADDSAEHGYEYEFYISSTGYSMIPPGQIGDY